MMLNTAEHVEMNYPLFPDSRYVTQPVIDLLFPWKEEGPAENLIKRDEDEGISEPRTTLKEPTIKSDAMKRIPVLRFLVMFQTIFETQLLEGSSICKQFRCLVLFYQQELLSLGDRDI